MTDLNSQMSEKFKTFSKKFECPRKTYLLNEGDVCKQVFLIEEGCLRSWFNDNGNDITFQFFFEGNFVSSFESFKNNRPCLYNIETLTPAVLYVAQRADIMRVLENDPEIKEQLNELLMQRLYHYQKLFISRITHSPQRRYEELIKKQPQLINRVPQHYIATYLGITPVSLSRIKNKIALFQRVNQS